MPSCGWDWVLNATGSTLLCRGFLIKENAGCKKVRCVDRYRETDLEREGCSEHILL